MDIVLSSAQFVKSMEILDFGVEVFKWVIIGTLVLSFLWAWVKIRGKKGDTYVTNNYFKK